MNFKFIWRRVSQIKSGGHGRAYVVDAEGRLIAHPDISLVLRNTDMTQSDAGARGARRGGQRSAEQVQVATISWQRVLTAYPSRAARMARVRRNADRRGLCAPLASIERTGACFARGLAWPSSPEYSSPGRMVVPIQALPAGAARIGSGDLSQRISIKTGDEVEGLADIQRHGRPVAEILRGSGAKGRAAHPRTARIPGTANRHLRHSARHCRLAR